LYFQRRKKYGTGGWGPLNAVGSPCALHNLHNLLLCHWVRRHWQ